MPLEWKFSTLEKYFHEILNYFLFTTENQEQCLNVRSFDQIVG